ncbi:MAG: TonB family protein [Breznakibacter sp.]
METFASYLFKSTVWLTCFALVYHLVLRNERFFVPIRGFLLGGLLASLLFPLLTVRYVVNVPIDPSGQHNVVLVGQPVATVAGAHGWEQWLWAVYCAGVLVFMVRLLWQIAKVVRVIHQAETQADGAMSVVSTNAYRASFTFFSYVFINPSLSEIERREIIKHEASHVGQRHWVDLILAETVLLLQWFNPVAWLYGRYIRQNHEFLADRSVLDKATEPAVYKAVLLNQVMGGEAVRIGHLFNYSLNKKRFKMMTHTIEPSWRKFRLLWAVPAMALVFYAFAVPEYKQEVTFRYNAEASDSTKQENVAIPVRPFDGKNILVLLDGKEIDMETMKKLDPNSIQEISVLKDKSKLEEYGSKAGDGVILITSKKESEQSPYGANLDGVVVVGYTSADLNGKSADAKQTEQQTYQTVDQMPEYPGGTDALIKFIASELKYPVEAQKRGIQGKVFVKFVVAKTGKVINVQVIRGLSPTLDEEALRVVKMMPDWKPGVHQGKKVDVDYTLPITFALRK